MEILLFGKNGQLGSELRRCLLPLGPLKALDKEDLDLSNPDAVAQIIQTLRPAIIINASAYTAVDQAESQPELAFQINTRAPEIMAQTAGKIGAAFIHFSTDYVFDGAKNSPYNEKDLPNPLNAYGQGKLEGEQHVLQTSAAALILRTSWVYSLRGDSFVTKTLAWARQHETLRIVDDQVARAGREPVLGISPNDGGFTTWPARALSHAWNLPAKCWPLTRTAPSNAAAKSCQPAQSTSPPRPAARFSPPWIVRDSSQLSI